MSDKPDDLLPDVDALAVQEQFLAEWRAGHRPRLSVYALRYPQYAGALAELVASLAPDMSVSGAVEETEPLTEFFPERLWLGAGVERALANIFGSASNQRTEPRVAEARAEYQATREQDATTADAQRDEPTSD